MRKFFLVFLFAIGLLFLINACSDDDEVKPCDCPAATPWSKPGADNCYTSKADCESAEGGTCQICN